ncbi:MAG: flagellar assembly protein FliW [bacterium]|jgi:flagellar assembly factor FliW|nr:MAG: hypothetical protein DIU52_11175 [bacterium]
MSLAAPAPATPAPTSPTLPGDAAADEPPIAPIRVEFADGLIGLPERRAFLLSRAAAPGAFWLESADCEGLAFLLVDPFPFFDGYTVELEPAQLRGVLDGDPSEIAVLAIVTLPPEPDGVYTANLQAPLAINLRTGRARQIVLTRTDFGTRCPLSWDPAA